MESKLSQPRVALITGGSSGIGLATSCLFAAAGYRLAICGRNADRLRSATETIWQSILAAQPKQHPAESSQSLADSGMDEQIMASSVDLNDVSQTVRFAEQALERFGKVDVLINNAAIAPLANFEEISEQNFETTVNTNLRSPFYLTQVIWRAMKQRSQQRAPDSIVGTIVNISSLAAVDPFPGFSLYGASKAWLDLMTQALAVEGRELGIRVCSVRPGAVETQLLRSLFPDFPADQCVAPEDVANMVWQCVTEPDLFPSGQAFTIAR